MAGRRRSSLSMMMPSTAEIYKYLHNSISKSILESLVAILLIIFAFSTEFAKFLCFCLRIFHCLISISLLLLLLYSILYCKHLLFMQVLMQHAILAGFIPLYVDISNADTDIFMLCNDNLISTCVKIPTPWIISVYLGHILYMYSCLHFDEYGWEPELELHWIDTNNKCKPLLDDILV